MSSASRATALRYVTDEQPGIRRVKVREGFRYVGPDGKVIRDRATVNRIKALVIPPAWTDVWICPQADGHLQAIGRDQRAGSSTAITPATGPLKTRPSSIAWSRSARRLPTNPQGRGPRPGQQRACRARKVLAAVVRLLETSLIRVGNEEYAKENGSLRADDDARPTRRGRRRSSSASSSRARAASTTRSTCGTVGWRRSSRSARTCRAKNCSSTWTTTAQVRDIGSDDVNEYLRDVAGDDFTAKDFRTWAGTVLAALALQGVRGVRLGNAGQAECDVGDQSVAGEARATRRPSAGPATFTRG